MNYRIFHDPRCSRSRATPALLQEAGARPILVRDGDAAVIGRAPANAHRTVPA